MRINISALVMSFLVFSILFFPTSAHLAEIQTGPVKKQTKWYLDNSLTGPVQVIISVPDQKMSVYRNGEPIIESRISSGRPGHNTPAGVFSILEKRSRHFSNLYDNAPMPFMQRLTWSGVALHAGNVSRRFASHGCIRMPYNFAQNLFRYTRRGAHVVIVNEQARPKEITHSNLIAPTPRLVRVEKKISRPSISLSTPAYASSRSEEKDGTIDGYKRIPTVAEARLDRLKAEKIKATKDIANAKNLLKKQKQDIQERGKAYYRINTKTASLQYKYQNLTKQLRWAKDRLVYVKKSEKKRLIKTLTWLEVTEKKHAKLSGELAQVNAEIVELQKQYEEAIAAKEKTRRLKQKIASLKWKRSRLLKKVKWTEKRVAVAKKSSNAQYKRAMTLIDKAEKQLEKLNNRLTVFNVEYLPIKKKRTEAGKHFETAKAQAKNTSETYRKLQYSYARLSSEIKQAKRMIRLQKKPLRILLTRSTRKNNVRDIQQSLADLGYTIEKIDGLYGQETRQVIKNYQKDNNLKVSGIINSDLINSMRKKLGREPLKAGHIYVRQGFVDIFNAPVEIAQSGKALGTHFYTVMNFSKKDTQARWNVVTIKSRKQIASVKTDRLATGSITGDQRSPSSANEALDRITLPETVKHFLSRRLTPGSSLVIADKGHSHETGKGTDFIVLAR